MNEIEPLYEFSSMLNSLINFWARQKYSEAHICVKKLSYRGNAVWYGAKTKMEVKWRKFDLDCDSNRSACSNLRWGGSYTDIKSYLLSWLLLHFRCQIQFPRKAGVNPLWYKTIQI